jgi:putative DNA primase/helicase
MPKSTPPGATNEQAGPSRRAQSEAGPSLAADRPYVAECGHDPDTLDGGVDEIAEAELDAIVGPGREQHSQPLDPQRYAEADRKQGFHGGGEVECVVVENWAAGNWDGRLTKSFRVAADGTIEEGKRATTGNGRLVRVRLKQHWQLRSLMTMLERLKPTQSVMCGSLPGPAPMRRMVLKARWDRLPEAERDIEGEGPLWRGKCVRYLAGQPALVLLDHDVKDWPAEVQRKVADAGGLAAVLAKCDPQWVKAGCLERPSVSTGIRHRRSGVTTPGGGLHRYAIATDGADVPRYARVLFERMLLLGFGYATVSKRGKIDIRTPIDRAASGIPFWLGFEADAILETDQLEHVPGARACRLRDGPPIDTSKLADLTPDEALEVAALRAQLKAEKQDEANAIRLEHAAARIAKLRADGLTQAEAERRVLAEAEAGRLSLDETYCFDDGRQATGRQILANAEAFVGATSGDPLEPDYGGGRNKALWYRPAGAAGLGVHSQAHGGQRFHLALDAEDVVALASGLEGTEVAQAIELRDTYAQLYWPVDAEQAGQVLAEAKLPTFAALVFLDPKALDVEHLIDLLRAKDYVALARLKPLGRFFASALEVVRSRARIGLHDDLEVDWDGLDARLEAEAAKLAAEAAKAATKARLPVITIEAGKTHKAADRAEAVLAARIEDHPVLQRGGLLVRPVLQKFELADGSSTMSPGLAIMTPVMLIDDLAHSARFEKFDGRSKKIVRIDPPEAIAKTLLSRAGRWKHVPVVKGVISAPTLRRDGSILHQPGYDASTRLFHWGNDRLKLAPEVLGNPGKDDAVAALRLLEDLLREVPFADAQSRSVGLSLLITPVIRAALNFSPLHLVRAATAGSGKTFLVDLSHTILTGWPCPVFTAGKTVEEFEKRLDGKLLSGAPMFSIDNLVGELESAQLNVALTGAIIDVRRLGYSEMIKIENTACIAATGNNARLVGDLGRRHVTCELDAKMERPELRRFGQDPVAMVLADRGKYLSACLCIPRAYMLAGMPGRLPPLAGFVDWSNLVRSALVWLGQEDPVRSLDTAYAEDETKQTVRRLVEAWAVVVGLDKPWTAKELSAKADEYNSLKGGFLRPTLRDAIAGACPSHELGHWLRGQKGKVFENVALAGGERVTVQIVAAGLDPRERTTLWKLMRS